MVWDAPLAPHYAVGRILPAIPRPRSCAAWRGTTAASTPRAAPCSCGPPTPRLPGCCQLLALLDKLVDSGKSVIVIEHHQAVMAHADWIIDLGPGAGHDGGRVVFEGPPSELVAARSTLTGRHLAAFVGRG